MSLGVVKVNFTHRSTFSNLFTPQNITGESLAYIAVVFLIVLKMEWYMWVTPKTKQRPGKARQAWGCILSLKVFAWVGPLLTTLISVIFPVVQGRLAKLDCFLPKLIPNIWSFYLPFHCLQGASPDCKMMGTPANVHSQLKCYLLLGAFCDYTIYIVSPLLALSWSHRSVWSSLFTTWNCLAHWLVLSSSLLLGSKLHGHRDRVCPLHYLERLDDHLNRC